MDPERERRLRDIQAEIRSGRYRVDIDALAVAVLGALPESPSSGPLRAAILLPDRPGRALFHLGFAERGISSACFAPSVAIKELLVFGPGLIVAEPGLRSHLHAALPNAELLPAGEGALRRPFSLAAIRSALGATLPSPPARRWFLRVLVVESDGVLVEQIRAGGCSAIAIADPRALFLQPPRGPFDLIFLGPSLSAQLGAREALGRLYGPNAQLCPI